jgi:hypothetical protein
MIKLTGKIQKIFQTEVRGSADKPFSKRLFWLQEVSDKYPSIWQLELWQGDCTMIDAFGVGDYVTCYIDIKGQHWSKDGREGVMNTLKCWNFEKDGKTVKEITK